MVKYTIVRYETSDGSRGVSEINVISGNKPQNNIYSDKNIESQNNGFALNFTLRCGTSAENKKSYHLLYSSNNIKESITHYKNDNPIDVYTRTLPISSLVHMDLNDPPFNINFKDFTQVELNLEAQKELNLEVQELSLLLEETLTDSGITIDDLDIEYLTSIHDTLINQDSIEY